jgi:hypothetical protein
MGNVMTTKLLENIFHVVMIVLGIVAIYVLILVYIIDYKYHYPQIVIQKEQEKRQDAMQGAASIGMSTDKFANAVIQKELEEKFETDKSWALTNLLVAKQSGDKTQIQKATQAAVGLGFDINDLIFVNKVAKKYKMKPIQKESVEKIKAFNSFLKVIREEE